MFDEKYTVQQSDNSANNQYVSNSANIPPYTPPVGLNIGKKDKIKTDFLDVIAPFAGYFTIFFLLEAIFDYSNNFIITLSYLFFLTFTTVYIVSKNKVFPKKAIFPLLLCILTGLNYSFYDIGANLVSIPFLFYFSGLYCMNLTNTVGGTFDGYISFYRQLQAIISVPMSKLFLPLVSIFNNRKSIKKKRRFGVLIGVVCGIPIFIIVANLLIEGDAAFSSLMNGFIDKVTKFLHEIFDKIFSDLSFPMLVASLFFTPYIVSTVFAFRHGVVKEKLSGSNPDETAKNLRFVSSGILSGFYGVVALCYVIYLLSQLSYLFGAFSGEFTVSISSYARRGFFEMSAVAFINLCLIGAGAILSKRDQKGNLPKAYKIFSLFFCLFTMLLIVTAMSKMGLYISELGLTHKRIQVFLADIVLFIAFACILIKIFRQSFPYLKITLYTCLSLVCLYFVVSPDTVIAKFNTWAYLSGYHEEVDVDEISYLENKYQVLVNLDKIAQSDNGKVSDYAKGEVYRLYRNLNGDYYDYNINVLKAKKYAKDNSERLSSYISHYSVNYFDDFDEYPVITSNFETSGISLCIETSKKIKSVVFRNEIADVTIDKESGNAMGYSESADFDWAYLPDSKTFATVTVTEENGKEHIITLVLSDDEDPDKNDNTVYLDSEYFYYRDLVLNDGKNGTLVIDENSYYW